MILRVFAGYVHVVDACTQIDTIANLSESLASTSRAIEPPRFVYGTHAKKCRYQPYLPQYQVDETHCYTRAFVDASLWVGTAKPDSNLLALANMMIFADP